MNLYCGVALIERHKWGEEIVIKEATCDHDGSYERVCNSCGWSEEYTKEQLGHDFQIETKSRFLIFDEILIHTCKHCGMVYRTGGTFNNIGKILFAGVVLAAICIILMSFNIKSKAK